MTTETCAHSDIRDGGTCSACGNYYNREGQIVSRHPLTVGQLVYKEGYEFRVVTLCGSVTALDGKPTHYYLGECTDSLRNATIQGTGYARGVYSYRAS